MMALLVFCLVAFRGGWSLYENIVCVPPKKISLRRGYVRKRAELELIAAK